MKIAVAATGNTMEDVVPDTFEESRYLLIVETDDGSCHVFPNPEAGEGPGLAMAREIISQDCEAVICGSLEKPAYDELMIAQVTRYLGPNLRASEALRLMEAYQLDIIRVPKGEVYDPHWHEHSPSGCDGHDH